LTKSKERFINRFRYIGKYDKMQNNVVKAKGFQYIESMQKHVILGGAI